MKSTAAEALRVLGRHVRIAGAFVFGSQVEGTSDEYSDIDLAVFVEGCEDWGIRRCAQTAALVQREAGDNIEIHFFSAKALTNSEPASFATYVKERGVKVPVPEGK